MRELCVKACPGEMEQLTFCSQKAVLAKMAVNINLEKGTLWGLCMAGGAKEDLRGRDPGGIFLSHIVTIGPKIQFCQVGTSSREKLAIYSSAT